MTVIDRQWIEFLVRSRAQESLHLDFKRELPGKKEDNRRELLKDVAAMANSEGGRIVYGIREGDDACAEEILPITDEDRDDAQRRLDQSIVDGIVPRLAGCKVLTVIVDGGFILAVDVPPQYGGPFQTSFNNQRRFVYRQGTMNIEMNYVQIRDAFQRRGRAFEAATSWRKIRLNYFNEVLRKRQLDQVAWLVLHVMPHEGLFDGALIDLPSIARDHHHFLTDYGDYRTYTAEGLLYREGRPGENPASYARLMRSGLMEIAWKGRKNEKQGELTVLGYTAADNIRRFASDAASLLVKAGIFGPAYIALTGVNMESHRLVYPGPDYSEMTMEPWDAEMDLPMLDVQSIEELATSPDTWCRPLSDMLFQTFGVEQCPFYTSDGDWMER